MSNDIHKDAYSIGLYRDCHRKYDLRINQSLTTKDAGPGRNFGTVLHKAREVWRESLLKHEPRATSLAKAQLALDVEYAKLIGTGVGLDERRSLANAKWLFDGYTKKFINHDYQPIQIETPFDLLVGTLPDGTKAYRTGIFDEFCTFNGRSYVLDFKTATPYPGASWFDGWRTSDQFMGYLWAARQMFGEVHGVIVHGVWVKAPAKTSRSKYKPEDYFTADIITYTDAQLDEWRTWFLRTVDRIRKDEASGEWEPAWGSACKAYNSPCDFSAWCKADPATRPMIESIYYEKTVWQPTEIERVVDAN